MKNSKPKELREKTIPELQEMLKVNEAELYQSRRDLVFRKHTDMASIGVRRHNIARIMTIISEKQKGANA